jgi:lysine-N-methylase
MRLRQKDNPDSVPSALCHGPRPYSGRQRLSPPFLEYGGGICHSMENPESVVMTQQFYPDFLREFACKCGGCRQTCCRDWEIRLTKQEFQEYRSDKLGAECQALAEKYLKPDPNSQGDEDYALCVMQSDGYCSLLTADRLCAWKKLRGEGLCATCRDFPQTYISFLEDEYVFPSLSCEAIVELLLNKSDSVRLVSESVLYAKNHYHARIEEMNFGRRPLLQLYPDLTQWGLTLLQDRRFSLDDRMVLLANAMCLIDWMERNCRIGGLPDAMDRFLKIENLQQVLHKYDQYAIGPKALLTVNGYAFVRLANLARYQTKARLVLDGLGIEVVEIEENGDAQCRLKRIDSEKYLRRKEDLAGFMRQKEMFLEHVMVCEYLRSMTPVTEPSVWDNFKFFNVCYALLKGILLGSFHSSPSDAEMVDTLVLLHRLSIHDYEAHDRTLEHLKAIQLIDLLSMVALAKG